MPQVMEPGVDANLLRKWVMQESSGVLGRGKRRRGDLVKVF